MVHWVDGVEETGPLWSNSMFGLESLNGSITRHNKSNHSILLSALMQYMSAQEAHRYLHGGTISETYYKFCTEMLDLRQVYLSCLFLFYYSKRTINSDSHN